MEELQPRLVIVGMSLGSMEGLEFLARLMQRYRSFDGKVVILPDKGDPFPPVMQFRDPATGRSITEEIDFGALKTLVDALTPADAARPLVSEQPAPPPESVAAELGLDSASILPVAAPVTAPAVPEPKPPTVTAFGAPATGTPLPVQETKPRVENEPAPVTLERKQEGVRPPKPVRRPAFDQKLATSPMPHESPAPQRDAPAEEAAAAGPAPKAPVLDIDELLGANKGARPAQAFSAAAARKPEPIASPEAKNAVASADFEPKQPAVEGPPQTAASALDAKADASSKFSAEQVWRSLRLALPRQKWMTIAVLAAFGAIVLIAAVFAFGGASSDEIEPTAVPRASLGGGALPAKLPSQPPSAPKSAAVARDPTEAELITLPLRFRKGSHQGSVSNQKELNRTVDDLVRALAQNPSARLEVGGHTSTEGAAEVNNQLGRRRAISAKIYLVSRGLAAERIVVKSYEAAFPVPGGSAKSNRRVTVRVVP
jgi:outer membrane protein OmpA-like peptidoglycan-associated protein